MKICAAQIAPVSGKLEENIALHIRHIVVALSHGADLIVFPELSLTGYAPGLAHQLATSPNDPRLNVFQLISDSENISICAGLPTPGTAGVYISMVIFQPGQARQTYSKQYLHADEAPFFIRGTTPVLFRLGEETIAPAICYESLLPEHAEAAWRQGAEIYLTSVAKSAHSIKKAYPHYAQTARKYSIPVIMSNSIGPCDSFESAGRSAIWDKQGVLAGQLDAEHEGLLLFDTRSGEIARWTGLRSA